MRPDAVRAARHEVQSHELGAHPDGTCHLRQPGERIADEHRGEQHRQVQPKQHAEYDARHNMHGQRSRRNEGDEQPEGERAGHAVPIEGPAAAIEHEGRKRLQTPEFLQRSARSGVMRFSQRCMDCDRLCTLGHLVADARCIANSKSMVEGGR
jgi:hypothetical protein